MPPVQNELVVMGLSMGGLIAKYTLSDMESRNKAHNTRMYISIDSPHGGANVPIALETFFSQLYNLYIFPPQLLGGIIVGEFITPIFESAQVLNSQAANEMKLNHDATISSFLSQLRAMDMPSSVNLAVANGSHAGQVQATGLGTNYSPGMVMVSADLNTNVELFNHEFIEADITARARYDGGANREIYRGVITQVDELKSRRNSAAFDLPLETMPGGFTDLGNVMGNFINQINNPNIQVNFQRFNFVSTYSAFGMDQRNARYLENMGNPSVGQGDRSVYIRNVHDTGFDDIFSEANNNEHVTFTPAVSQWLLDKITENDTDHCTTIITTDFPISGPSNLSCGQGYQKFSTVNVPGVNYSWKFTPGNWDYYTNEAGNELFLKPSGDNFSGEKSIWLEAERVCNGVALMEAPTFKDFNLDAGDNGELSGPFLICTSNTTISLSNIPASMSVNWSKSSNLTVVSSSNSSATIKAASSSSSGNAWVKARITTNCGNFTVQKNVWVGKSDKSFEGISIYPQFTPVYDANNPVELCGGEIVRVTAQDVTGGIPSTAQEVGIGWDATGGVEIVNTGDTWADVRFCNSFSAASIKLRYENPCGAGAWTSVPVQAKSPLNCNGSSSCGSPGGGNDDGGGNDGGGGNDDGGGDEGPPLNPVLPCDCGDQFICECLNGYRISTKQNPVSSNFEFQIVEIPDEEGLAQQKQLNDNRIAVSIYNNQRTKLYEGNLTVHEIREFIYDSSRLPKGIYLVNFINNGRQVQFRILKDNRLDKILYSCHDRKPWHEF